MTSATMIRLMMTYRSSGAAVQNKRGRNTMNRNECLNCKYYEKCGRPSRPVKCMGYEKGDDRDETTRETGRHVSSTDS